MYKFIWILIVLSALFSSCKERIKACENFQKENGTIRYYYSSGKTKTKFNVSNCLYQGKYFEYYETGKVKIEGDFSKGMKVNDWNYFDSTGSLLLKREYDQLGSLKAIKGTCFDDQIILSYSANGEFILSNDSLNIPIKLSTNNLNNVRIELEDNNMVIMTNSDFLIYGSNLFQRFNLNEYENIDRTKKTNKWIYSLENDEVEIGMYIFNEQKGISELVKKKFPAPASQRFKNCEAGF